MNRTYHRGREVFPEYVDPAFEQHYKKYCLHSMVPWQGMHDAFDAAKYISTSGIEGDVVECGVWLGGVSALMRDVCFQYEGETHRSFWLFDTFEGMPPPGTHDFKAGRQETDTLRKHGKLARTDGTNDWCRGDVDAVKSTMLKSGRSMSNVHLIKGKVEKTLTQESIPDKIALLRLDTDFYSSTKTELEVLVPRLATGGILLVDDYGAWAGARKACDEYFDDHLLGRFAIFRNHFYGALIAIKTA